MPGPGASLGPRGARGFLTEEEKASMPRVTSALLKRILSYLKPYWLQFLFVFLAILVSAVVGLYPSVITGRIVDALGSSSTTVHSLILLILTAFAALTVSQAIGVLEYLYETQFRLVLDMESEKTG